MTDLTSVVSKAYTYRVEKVYLLRCWQLTFCFFFSCSTFPCSHNGPGQATGWDAATLAAVQEPHGSAKRSFALTAR